MSDTPRTDAMASEVEHLGPGGRALYQGRLWSLAYALEAELTSARAECDALRSLLERIVVAVDAGGVGFASNSEDFWNAIDAAREGRK